MTDQNPDTLASIPCSDVVPVPVRWLWEPYLARGKLSVLDGDPGTGKSFFTVDLAARLSAGAPLPSEDRFNAPETVLLLNAEDDASDTITPRVTAAAGDAERVRILGAPGLGLDRLPRFPTDSAALERAIVANAAALVVIDPMMAFFPPTISANSDQSIRQALTPLAAVAANTGACILLVRHLRKAGSASAIYRGLGSIGIMGAVRTGLMIARHPDDAELRVLALAKTNIGPPGRSLGYRLARRESGQTYVEWTGPLDLTVDDIYSATLPLRVGVRPRERAAEWLRQFLAEGPRRAAQVHEAARAAGIPDRTLDRVKVDTGMKSEAINADGKIEWWWRDPKAKRKDILFDDLPVLEALEPFDIREIREREQKELRKALKQMRTSV